MRFSALFLAIPFVLGAQAAAPTPNLSPAQLIREGRLAEAKTVVDAQLAKDKNDASALYFMGRIVYAGGNSGEAVDWFEKAIKRSDRTALYHYWLGSALGDEAQKASKLRQPFLARRVKSEFERAVQLDPQMIDARLGLVDFYSIAPGIMGGSMEKAKAQAAEIVKLNPMRGHIASARLASREKDLATAEREYRAAIAAAPDSSPGYNGLANFLRNQSRFDDAFATYDALLKAKPEDIPVHANWGITAAMSGKNLERGEREIKFWLEHAPKETAITVRSGVHYRLGQIYEKSGRKDLAKGEYGEALKLNAQNQDAKKALDALK